LPASTDGFVLTLDTTQPTGAKWAAGGGGGGGGGITWNTVSGTSQSAAVNNGYIANNASLPAVSAVGDLVWIVGKGAGGWQIAQNAGQTIHFGNQNTTVGAGGHLDSANQYDAIQLLCTAANTDWTCTGIVIGNIGVTLWLERKQK
jgi:hypothetical protein